MYVVYCLLLAVSWSIFVDSFCLNIFVFSSVLHVLSAYSISSGKPFAESLESAIIVAIAFSRLSAWHSAR